MRVIYRGVDLMPIETHYFNWESVYDDTGVDYLYTRVSMGCRALVNSISSKVTVDNGPPMNYGFGAAKPPPAPAEPTRRASPGSTAPVNIGPVLTVPAGFGIQARARSTLRTIVRDPVDGSSEITHQSVRQRLSLPRGSLYIFWGDGMESGSPAPGLSNPPANARLFLQSPVPGEACDCKNGPFPRMLGVVEALGDATTLMVDWSVETYINETVLNEVRETGPLLSNRFAQSHTIDEHGYTTITTAGVAIYRTDFVFTRPQTPDMDRPFLFMPVPAGFVRRILYVRGREDVTGVEYAYEDKQVSVNFVAGQFVKAATISAYHRQAISSDVDFINSALAGYERVLNIRANRNMANRENPEAPARSIKTAVNKALDAFHAGKRPGAP